MAKKTVLYPNLLDGFGKELLIGIEKLKKDTLKPAIVKDVIDAANSIFHMQQLLTISYNLSVQNYETMMNKLVAVEKKVEDLTTRVAGYSERINAIEVEIKKPRPFDEEGLIRLIKENSKIRGIIFAIGR